MKKHEEELRGLTDEQLAVLARDDHQKAFALLADRCAPLIRWEASRFRGSSVEPEDLAQEGLLGLLGAVRHFSPGNASFQTYASVCIRHRMVSVVRKSQAVSVSPAEWEEVDGLIAEEDADPASLIADQESSRQLYRWLQQLLTPLEYRVLLFRLVGLSYEDTAARLGISSKSVDNAMQRVRRKCAVGFPSED